MKQPIGAGYRIELGSAVKIVDAFAASCGIPCRLVDAEGVVLYQQTLGQELCAQYRSALSSDLCCDNLHLSGAYQAERLGGRYIYLCPSGMGWISSPILVGGQIAGALVAGPVLMMELEDYIASTPMFQETMPLEKLETITGVLRRFPKRSPAQLSHISLQLLANAVYLGDSSRALLEHQESEMQQQNIGGYIQQLKLSGASPGYPRDKEKELLAAITSGDETDARRLLNELLGHILFASGGNFAVMRARSLELMALLSRAAADGGAELEQVLSLNQRFLAESDHLRSADDLTIWLTQVLVRYTSLMFRPGSIQRRDVVYKALHHMKRHLAEKITLEDTARQVGFSPTYFSKVFKDELGIPFVACLSRLRMERAKSLLLSTELSVGEVCTAVGYEDQSYFIKVFRQSTGVTPGRFRKKQGRLDDSKEREAGHDTAKGRKEKSS